jgi:hypothetical protein
LRESKSTVRADSRERIHVARLHHLFH